MAIKWLFQNICLTPRISKLPQIPLNSAAHSFNIPSSLLYFTSDTTFDINALSSHLPVYVLLLTAIPEMTTIIQVFPTLLQLYNLFAGIVLVNSDGDADD